jgi:hypothetical protein
MPTAGRLPRQAAVPNGNTPAPVVAAGGDRTEVRTQSSASTPAPILKPSLCGGFKPNTDPSNPLFGLRCGAYLKPEPLFARTTRMVVETARTGNNPNGIESVPSGKYRIISTDQLLDNSVDQMLIGFGQPKVTTLVARGGGQGYDKLDAAPFFKRKNRLMAGDSVQSGIFIRPRNLPPAAFEALRAAMQQANGHRSLSSARATAKMLTKAGFTSGGKKINNALPYRLFVRIAERGLEFRGTPVTFDIVSTTTQTLDQHFRKVVKEEVGNILNPLQPAGKDTPANGAAGSKPTEQPPAPVGAGQAGSTDAAGSSAPVGDPAPAAPQAHLGLRNSRPGPLGSFVRGIIGAHVLWEVLPDQKLASMDQYMPTSLHDKFHRGRELGMGDTIKKHIFAPGKVSFLRHNMARAFDKQPQDFSPNQLLTMLRLPGDGEEIQPDEDGLIKYNIVMCGNKSPRGERVVLARLKVDIDKPDDILSKHVLMAGYDPDVRFAGTCWGERYTREDGSCGVRLHVKGDSGSYMPNNTRAEAAGEYLRHALPGVEVVVHPMEFGPPKSKPDYLRTYAVPPEQLTALRSNLDGKTIKLRDDHGHVQKFKIRKFRTMEYETRFYDTPGHPLLDGNGMLRTRTTFTKPGSADIKDIELETKVPAKDGSPYQLRAKGAGFENAQAWQEQQADELANDSGDPAVRLARTIAGDGPMQPVLDKNSVRELYLVSPTTFLIGRFQPSFFIAVDTNAAREPGQQRPALDAQVPRYHVMTPGIFTKLPWTKTITPARIAQLEDLCRQLSDNNHLQETRISPYAEAAGFVPQGAQQ